MNNNFYGGFDAPAFSIDIPTQGVQPKNKKRQGRGGTLTSLISEGGALGGAAAGAAAGSVVPIIGTTIGGVLGGALGAFGGRLAENKVRDDRLGIGDATKEAALTGVFGAPIRSLKYAGTGLAKLGGGGGLADALAAGARKADGAVANGVAGTVTSSAASSPSRTSVSGQLDELANKALSSQYGTISKPVARSTNPEKTFGQLAELGVTKPSDVERISNAITGTSGLLNRAVAKAAGNSRPVDVSNLRQILNDAMANNGVVDSRAKELTTMFDAQMNRLLGGPSGSLSTTANPSDVLDVMKSFEKRIAQKAGKGGNYRLATDETTNQANALRLVVDELQGRLESGADVKTVLTPELRNKLLSLQPGNAKWQNYVNNQLMNSGDIKSLRSAQSPFVNASKIINEADMNSMTFGGRVGNNAGSIRDTIINAIAAPLKSPVIRAGSAALKSASNLTRGIPIGTELSGLAGGMRTGAQGQAAEGLVSALTNRGDQSSSDPSSMIPMPLNADLNTAQMNQESTNNPMPTSNIMEQVYQNTGDLSSALAAPRTNSTYSRENAILDIKRDPKNADYYMQLYEFTNPKQQKKDNGLDTTTANLVASSANATNTLDQLKGLFGTAGGGSGKIGGAIKNTLARAGLEGNAQTYNDLSASSVSQLARALNGGGQVSDADAAVVVQALPRITDSPDVAAKKFAALRQRLLAARQNTLLFNSGASQESDLGSALAM